MRLEAKKYLFDIKQAAHLLDRFTNGKTQDDYINDPMLRSAVERQFGIMGEAVSKLAKLDPETALRISDYRSNGLAQGATVTVSLLSEGIHLMEKTSTGPVDL